MSELRWYLLLIGAVILLWIYFTGRRQTRASKHDVFHHHDEGHANDVLMHDKNGELLVVEEEKPVKSFEEALAEVNAMQVGHSETEPLPEPDMTDDVSLDVDGDIMIVADEADKAEPRLPDDADERLIESEVRPEVESGIVSEEEEAPADAPLELVMIYVVAPEEKPFLGRAILKAFHVHKLRFGEHEIFHRESSASHGRRPIFSISNMLKPGTLAPDYLQTADVLGLGLFMQIPGPVESIAAFNEMLHTAQHLASTLGGTLRDETLQPLTEETVARIRRQLVEAGGESSHG